MIARPGTWRLGRLRHVLWVALVSVVLGAAAILFLVESGAADRMLRGLIVRRLAAITGGQVELRSFVMDWRHLRPTLSGLTIHGREPAGTPPFFSADTLVAGLRIDSFWGRKFSLENLSIERPQIHLRIDSDGSSNVPLPKRPAGAKFLTERLFELHVSRLQLNDGTILYNGVLVPLVAEGGDFRLSIDAATIAGAPVYLGQWSWQHATIAARRYLPFPADFSAKFTIEPDALRIEQLLCVLPHSQLDAQAQLSSFARPAWTFRYRGWLNFEDIRDIMRKPMTPSGRADFGGEGSFANGQVHTAGRYSARDIAMHEEWFHAGGMTSRGAYRLDNHGVETTDFSAEALGGRVTGRVSLQFAGQAYRAETRVEGVNLEQALNAVTHRGFPVRALDWDARLSADTVTAWNGEFKQLEVSGTSTWSPVESPAPGLIPIAARWGFRYRRDRNLLTLGAGEFATPTSRAQVSGTLGIKDSLLNAQFETRDLASWSDFFEAIQDRKTGGEPRIGGHATWTGRITGPLDGPAFVGHVRGDAVRYEAWRWDSMEGDVSYSPNELSLARGHARRGSTEANIELTLSLSRWRFAPENTWTMDASLARAPLGDVLALAGASYPLQGFLTGQFHGRGSRQAPEVAGLFDIEQGQAWGFAFDRFRGQLTWRPEEFRISDAELRAFSTGPANGHGPALITGSFSYRFPDRTVALDLAGAALPLEGITAFKNSKLPVGGRLSFQLTARGPITAPVGEGSMRLVDLSFGKEVLGSFDGRLSANGREARLEISSAMAEGRVTGTLAVNLSGDLPISGDVTVEKMNLDPFLLAALHLNDLTGQSRVDGRFHLTGALRRPETIAVEADLSRLEFGYENVRLENVGPVRFRSSRDELRLEQARLRGADSNFEIAGSAHFTGSRAINLRLNGAVNLQLATTLFAPLEARGSAQVGASFEGTLDRPTITGRVHIENASARYGDFPSGLSAVNGDLVFDSTRLLFDNMTAQTGGGTLLLSGTVNYAESPARFDINARTDGARIRYPEGMSWLARGTLRFSGTTEAAVLSGHVNVDRLVMSQGLDVASMMLAAKEGVPSPAPSPFLRNLQFNIEAGTSADARMEWPGAQFETEASLRVRGTWERPILLGHIHLLSGELSFRGTRYQVYRGEINFSNPFRLVPVVNVEATTTIQQYEISLSFSGPADKLTLAYRSDPPLPATDIITLLALGRTGQESELRSASQAQGATAGASTLLSEAISSQLGGRLERLFGITRFRVDPALASTATAGESQNAAARVTVEQRLTPELTVTYITNVTSSQQQVIQVEYSVKRNLSIVALRDQNGTFGLDIKRTKRFK
ncbi:MAG: translocation/assembly module TamB domain-containing protein [Candidatus Acidiferrales bacterium]